MGVIVRCWPGLADVLNVEGQVGALLADALIVMFCVCGALSPIVALWACHLNESLPVTAPAV